MPLNGVKRRIAPPKTLKFDVNRQYLLVLQQVKTLIFSLFTR